MKIYTRAGDTGETGLYGGSRVRKDALRVEAYGTLDELNAALGVVVASLGPELLALDGLLTEIQSELFDIGAELATPPDRVGTKLTSRMRITDEAQVERLERAIDDYDARLGSLKTFILPGGTLVAARLHLARTVARRAERRIVALASQERINPEIIRYLNRLSDLLFVLARAANHLNGVQDVPWVASSGGD